MRRDPLAKILIAAKTDAARTKLLREHQQIADLRLAEEIRKICHSSWTSEPVTSQRAAAAMATLRRFKPDDSITAIEAWVRGISLITRGKFELAVRSLEDAEKRLESLGRQHDSAQTQMAKLLALGMLGRYDDAVVAGEKALSVFLQNEDERSAGKIEVNLSNVVSRNGAHGEAERYCLSARRRFKKLGLTELQAVAENGLANTYSELYDFEKADRFYRMALETARTAGMRVTEAEIEASIGNLAQVRGRYAEALKFLERSRGKYESLEMPHQSAIADLQIADLYAELNLKTEAADLYTNAIADFERLKMRAEEARASLNYGRLALLGGKIETAGKQLKRALNLYKLEKNNSGRATALLAQARLALVEGKGVQALKILNKAEPIIVKSESPRDIPVAHLLEGQAHLLNRNHGMAARKLQLAYDGSKRLRIPDLSQAALCSLGELSAVTADPRTAEKHFKAAIKLIEGLRAPLAAEEFTMSFLASRLDPYDRLARLYLDDGRIASAFRTIESGRSRALLDALDRHSVTDQKPSEKNVQLEQVRAELNLLYKRLERASEDEIREIRSEVIKRESSLADLTRRIASVKQTAAGPKRNVRKYIGSTNLHLHLGKTKVLVEFVEFEGVISAFVIGGGKIRFVSGITTSARITSLIDDLHFQFGALRYGPHVLERFRDGMRERADSCLERLHETLITPLEPFLTGTSIVFVPVGVLNYVPFHALRTNAGYLIERFEITHAPSASVWERLQERPARTATKPLLMGFADERIPLVETEVRNIKKILPGAKALTGKSASFSAFSRLSSKHDLIHLACHGQFRPESPMFSSLHLADGWITVHDMYSQPLNASLVTLSACETGLSKVFAGDEILGLARGFLSAGASSLIVSLWTVNDRAAGELMARFYTFLQRGTPIASSLRDAQISFIRRGEHPYLWSPFILIGR